MQISFTPEQEEQLSQIASHAGTDPEHVVKDAVMRMVEETLQFRGAVREGLQQADRGELIDDQQVHDWIEAQERS